MNDTHGGFILTRGWFGEPEKHSEASRLGWKRRKSGLPPMYYEDLRKAHEQRRLNARLRDERLRAKHTIEKQEVYEGVDSYNVHSWAEQPGRKDVEGIDTPTATKLGTTPTRSIIKQEYEKLAREHYATGGVVEISELRKRVQARTKVSREVFDREILEMGKEGELDLKFHFQPTKKEVPKGIMHEKGLLYYVFDRNVKLGTTEVKTKAEPKIGMDWYQPALLPDGTYLAQTRDKRKKYTYKISWGISNPYHLKVYYEGHQIYDNKFTTKAEMREALEEQVILMKRMDARKEEKDVYDFIKANKGVAPREIKYMFGSSKAVQEALKTLEKEGKIHYREENMTYYIGSKPRKEKETREIVKKVYKETQEKERKKRQTAETQPQLGSTKYNDTYLEKTFKEEAKDIWNDSNLIDQLDLEIVHRKQKAPMSLDPGGRVMAFDDNLITTSKKPTLYVDNSQIKHFTKEEIRQGLRHEAGHLGYRGHTKEYRALAEKKNITHTVSHMRTGKFKVQVQPGKKGTRFMTVKAFNTMKEAETHALELSKKSEYEDKAIRLQY